MANEIRVFKRVVLAKRGTRAEAYAIADQFANPVGERQPTGEYAVEYTSVANQREQWRVIHITEVPDGTPDVHPSCAYMVRCAQGQLKDWGDGY